MQMQMQIHVQIQMQNASDVSAIFIIPDADPAVQASSQTSSVHGVCSAANVDTDGYICRYSYRYRCRYRCRFRYLILDIGYWIQCNDCAPLLTWILDNETDTDTDVLGLL